MVKQVLAWHGMAWHVLAWHLRTTAAAELPEQTAFI
jgi:hypothetical protein